MDGGNFNIITMTEIFFTSNISLFCIGMIATFSNFVFLKKIPAKIKKCGYLETILCGVINGIIIVFTTVEIALISPAWLMVTYPLIMVAEISFFSEDSSSTYWRMYLKCVFNFSCIY